MNEVTKVESNPVKKVVYPSYEATQLIPSIQAHGYEYSTPAASTTVDSPLGEYGETISYPTTVHITHESRAASVAKGHSEIQVSALTVVFST